MGPRSRMAADILPGAYFTGVSADSIISGNDARTLRPLQERMKKRLDDDAGAA
jgi:hypothetical protein